MKDEIILKRGKLVELCQKAIESNQEKLLDITKDKEINPVAMLDNMLTDLLVLSYVRRIERELFAEDK